jgi:FO synthase
MIDRQTALALAQDSDTDALMARASFIRDATYAGTVSYSRKVFIPLIQLCRDVCHYCTFAHPPRRGQRAYMTHEEILAVARAGAAAGCKEALFTLGDKPELRYRVARDELASLGHESTLSYLAEVCDLVFRETGMLPHVNAGVMGAEDMAMLRGVSVSQGLMLESISPRLLEKGGPHYGSPDKDPAIRLETIRIAGKLGVPFTTGILIGIGETRVERIESLLALRDLHVEYGHIQEVIVQNFRAKAGTKMSDAPEPSTEELLWTIAMARLLFAPDVTIQAPPNLSPGMLDRLIAAGLNDWGGVSPVTPDHVNPEAPWPHLDELARQTATAGKTLVERLAIYPDYALNGEKWLDKAFRTPVLRLVDGDGLPRTDSWMTGTPSTPPPLWAGSLAAASPGFTDIIAKARDGGDLSEADVTRLFRARGGEVAAVCEAADDLRRAMNGDTVSYVVTRNINYTNVCYFKCQFCAFSKGKMSENLRGQPYDLDMDEIIRRVVEAWERGATEVCMQGGIHPEYTGETYLEICRAVKAAVPGMHVHAYSPLEVWQGAKTLGIDTADFLSRLRDAGLGSLPGTAAEVLDDEVRAILCPDKVNTAQWFEVMEAAHNAGLRTTSTIMYGHVERPVHWARHLLRLRNLQKKTGGFTEFVPLPFVAEEAPIYLKGNARRGPTFREAVLMHAVARLALHPHITNIQTSWVKMGPEGVKACLNAGANDLGGTLMNETITRAAGASHGQEMPPEKMEAMIRDIGRVPVQRTTFYGVPPEDQVRISFGAAPLGDVVNTPARRYERDVKPVLYRPGLVGAAE